MNIEGKNPVKELLSSGAQIDKIIIQDGSADQELRQIQKLARECGVKIEFADKRLLDKKSETGHHQGIIAIQTKYKYR